MGDRTVVLNDSEVELLQLAINTSKDFLNDQKRSIIGAMAGHSKINELCSELDKLSHKLKKGS